MNIIPVILVEVWFSRTGRHACKTSNDIFTFRTKS